MNQLIIHFPKLKTKNNKRFIKKCISQNKNNLRSLKINMINI